MVHCNFPAAPEDTGRYPEGEREAKRKCPTRPQGINQTRHIRNKEHEQFRTMQKAKRKHKSKRKVMLKCKCIYKYKLININVNVMQM